MVFDILVVGLAVQDFGPAFLGVVEAVHMGQVNPEIFDYSQVNTEDYMWQNLIYSDEYQSYFVEHKSEVLSADLRRIFDLGVATAEQQKIVYGILLDKDELQHF